MNRAAILLLFLVLASSSGANAQNHSFSGDSLGPHSMFGRGCWGCHAPHSSTIRTADGSIARPALWGRNVDPPYGQALWSGDNGQSAFLLPGKASDQAQAHGADPLVGRLLVCLSCHDGKLARGPMMLDQVYKLPAIYGNSTVPTLHGAVEGPNPFSHPVGANAIVSCGGTKDWDCTYAEDGSIRMNGPRSASFVANYGWTVHHALYEGKQIVVCTSCHNQHVMSVSKVKIGGVSGYYKTYFGIRGNYAPGFTGDVNAITQFCRQCHADKSNEMNNNLYGWTKVTRD